MAERVKMRMERMKKRMKLRHAIQKREQKGEREKKSMVTRERQETEQNLPFPSQRSKLIPRRDDIQKEMEKPTKMRMRMKKHTCTGSTD